MKAVEASAKTREVAIQNALKELGVEMYEVDKIEVIDEGSKGLFGLGARPVRVRLVVESMHDEPQRDAEADARPPRRGNRSRDDRPRGEKRDERGNREPQAAREPATERAPRESNRGRSAEGKPRDERGEGKPRGERGERGRGQRDAKPAAETQAKRGEREGQRNRPERKRGERQGGEREGGDRQRNDRPRGDRQRGDRQRNGRTEAAAAGAPVEGDNAQDDFKQDRIEQPKVDTTAPITDDQGSEASALLEEIITKMGIAATAAFVRSEDGSARINVASEDSAILIGRKGRNLSALQYLINRIISRGDTSENTERIVLDVEGYVDRRRESLQELALSMASRAKETQRNMRLKPLSPQERRIIHVTLQDDEEIRTFSLGESLFRSVVISPKNATRPERTRSGRGSRGGRRRGGRGRSPELANKNESQDIDVGAFGD